MCSKSKLIKRMESIFLTSPNYLLLKHPETCFSCGFFITKNAFQHATNRGIQNFCLDCHSILHQKISAQEKRSRRVESTIFLRSSLSIKGKRRIQLKRHESATLFTKSINLRSLKKSCKRYEPTYHTGSCYACGVYMNNGGYRHRTNAGKHVFCGSCHNHLMIKFYPKNDAFHGALQGGSFSGR